jgi:hypothetical protein
MSYHCPQCGKEISFGEAICPHCQADTTSVWDQAAGKKETPKVIPGTGGMPSKGVTPFPPASGTSPFPPASGSSPFPPASSASPFPPASSVSPFPTPSGAAPFPPATPRQEVTPSSQPAKKGGFFEIPQNGGKLYLGDNPKSHYGREEIQGIALKALPDLNAYNNISRVRKDQSGATYSEHFIIHFKDGIYSIEDLHSTNGTYLNNTKLKGLPPQPMKDGDKVILPIEEKGKMVQLEMIFHKE